MKKIYFTLLSAIIWLWLNLGITMAENVDLSTNRPSPSTNQFINLTIETDSNYVGKLTFSAKYRSSTSANWTNISNLISSTYFSDYSSAWRNGYYKMISSDEGEITLKNLVKFRKKWYYRIYVKDTDWNQEYIQFVVNQNSSNYGLKISISPSNPEINEWIKLTIKTNNNYVGKINFEKLQYKSKSSSSRNNISMKSSTYVSDYSTQWSNWYYRMTTSDDGEAVLKNLVKFKKKWYYRIYLKGDEWNSNYLEFSVWIDSDEEDNEDDESNVSWFSDSELLKLKQTYKAWNSMIAQLKRKYPFLKKSISRNTLSNNFYDDMKDVVNNKKVRDFDDYDDFKKAFDDWYEYTMRNI